VLEVVGPSLTLRLPAPRDVPGLFALARDPEVTRWFSWGPYASDDEPRAWIDGAAGRREAGELLELVIERDGAPIGVTSLMELSRRDRRATIGSWLGREHWGTGANEATKALLFHLAFAALGLERLTAYAETRHERSQRALEKVGFTREGVLRAWHRHGDGPHDVVVFGLVRGDWRERPGIEVRGELPPAFLVSSGATPS
jgi:ribosomal-protein-alanine N-acetyltransferase